MAEAIAAPRNSIKDSAHITQNNGENFSDYSHEFLSFMQQHGYRGKIVSKWIPGGIVEVLSVCYLFAGNSQNQGELNLRLVSFNNILLSPKFARQVRDRSVSFWHECPVGTGSHELLGERGHDDVDNMKLRNRPLDLAQLVCKCEITIDMTHDVLVCNNS